MLDRIRKLKSQLTGIPDNSVPVPFTRRCECGHEVQGVRRTSWIEAECRRCGKTIFVLPANIYPSTPSVPSEFLAGTFAERLKVAVEELVRPEGTDAPSEPVEPPAEPRLPKTKQKKKRRQRNRVSETRPPESSESVASDETPADSKSDIAETANVEVVPAAPRRRIRPVATLKQVFSPFRMLMLAMISVVGLTGYWIVTEGRIETARQTWLSSRERAKEHLETADIVALEATLRKAVSAGRVLGKNDEDWRKTLNLLLESEAVNSLASANLVSAFRDAYDQRGRLLKNAVTSVAQSARSGYFMFDTWLSLDADGGYRMLLPATPGVHRVEVFIPLPALAELMESSPDGRALFCAKIADVKGPDEANGHAWQLLIAADSFVLVTSLPHCRAVGLAIDEDPHLRALLERQQAFVATSSSWESRRKTAVVPPAFQTQPTNENTK